MKSDKLALIEGKILTLMFLDIYIPVAPLRIGYEQLTMRDKKNSQSCFSIIIPPYFKDQIVA